MICPKCGYKDPFMVSWFDHEKEVAQFDYFKDWDPELFELLDEYPYIETDLFMYHKTKKSVERWKIELFPYRGAHREHYVEEE